VTVYAGILEPKNGAFVDMGSSLFAYHTYGSDGIDNPYGDDYQLAAEERYRVVGNSTWTTGPSTVGSADYVFYPANTFTANDYERQVRVQSSQTMNWSAWSESAFFTAVSSTPAPTITSPTAGQTVSVTHNVTWSAPTGINGYIIEVRTGANGSGTAEWNSGFVSGNVTSGVAQFLTNSVTRYVRVRVMKNGIYGNWAERQVTVTYTPPMIPTVVSTPIDVGPLGMNYALQVVPSNPTPSGGAPTVTLQDVWVRQLDNPAVEQLVQSNGSPGLFIWRYAAATTYQVKVVSRAANGTSSASAWTTATGPNTIKGFLLSDVPTVTHKSFRYNEDGASDDFQVQSALVEYAGREFPNVEFGSRSSRVISVPLVHSKGSADARNLLDLLRMRRTLLYRDSKGRKAYGRLEVGPTVDTFYGQTTSVTFTQTTYDGDKDVR
jgi:hypothetical protein